MEATQELREWGMQFLRHKDVILKRINSIEETEGGFKVTFKDGATREFLVAPWLEDILEGLLQRDKGDRLGVVVASNKKNIKKLAESWSQVKEFKFLTIYFANPETEGERKWIVAPYTHDKICDQKNISTGLKSMAELVEDYNP